MKLKYLWICILCIGFLNAANVQTDKKVYSLDERIESSFTEMLGDQEDWIAIYPAGSSNDWDNVIQWDWTGAVAEGAYSFNPLAVGEYEVRVFFQNSYDVEASYTFEVTEKVVLPAVVSTDKVSYKMNEEIVVSFKNMLGGEEDWIAIYPAGSSNDWDNVIQWDWTGAVTEGSHSFNRLAVGEYEVRVFFENSYNMEASYAFEVKENATIQTVVSTEKKLYQVNEQIVANFESMLGGEEDWIAIYPAGSSNDWDNVIQWDWTGAVADGSYTFDALAVGEYEVRVFFQNSYNLESSYAFEVQTPQVGDGLVILNEYNAVSSNNYLKEGGEDTYFGRIAGNGGSWMELVITGEHVDLRGVNLIITQDAQADFKAKLPQEVQLGHLRRGTILTISNEPTDVSYAPFSANGDDWTININANDLIVEEGEFGLSHDNCSVQMVQDSGELILLSTGERYTAVALDNEEVFKLKKDPVYGIAPSDASYGDDNDAVSYSTFGTPNYWDGKVQNFNSLRSNQELTEVGGIVISDIESLNGIEDGESLHYVAQNDILWIADDDSHRVYGMNLSTQTLESSFDDVALGEFAETIADECDRGEDIGACDIESIAYDEANDDFYIFVGKASSQSAIFRLTRDSVNDEFSLEDYIDLEGSEYTGALFIDGQLMVVSAKNIYAYDYSSNTRSEAYDFRSPDGKVYGLAYANGTLWLTTSTFKLIKVNWNTKVVESIYDMTKNGVYDPRGVEVINNKLYILEGMNSIGVDEVLAPEGHALRNAIHIYTLP